MNDTWRLSAFTTKREWFLQETEEKQGGSSSDTEDPSILAVLIPPSSTRPLDAMIYIILPSLWLESACLLSLLCTICLLSKLRTQLSAGPLCWLCPWRKAGIKRLLERTDVCDPTGCDTEPLSLSLCHKHLSVCHKHTYNRQTVSKTKTAHATSKIMSAVVWGERGEKKKW